MLLNEFVPEAFEYDNKASVYNFENDLLQSHSFSGEEIGLNAEYAADDYEVNITDGLLNGIDEDSILYSEERFTTSSESEIELEEIDSDDVEETIETLFDEVTMQLSELYDGSVDVDTKKNLLASEKLAKDIFSSCYQYNKRSYDDDDFLRSDVEILKEVITHLESIYKTNEHRVKTYFDFAFQYVYNIYKIDGPSYAVSKVDKEIKTQMNFILMTVESLYLKKLSRLEETLGIYESGQDAYNHTLNFYIEERKRKLASVIHDAVEVNKILEEERAYIEFKAKMKTVKFRTCPLLDEMSNDECVRKFGFQKNHIKTLARIFNITPHCSYTIKKRFFDPDGTSHVKPVTTTIRCDPVVQLMILLERQAHGTPLHLLESFYGLKKTKINDIERSLYHHIYQEFSHLLCIKNCKYNIEYMNLLVKKSTLHSKHVEPKTCYLIDGTHINICKPTRQGNQSFDPTYSGNKGSDTLIFQMVTDIFGLFIEVGTPEVGSCHDLKMLRESGLFDRLPLLSHNGEKLKVLGDAAYMDQGTRLHEQLFYVSKRSDTTNELSKVIQRANSSVRCAVERSFGLSKSMHKTHLTKFRNHEIVSDVPLRVIVSCLIINAKQIWYKTTTSGVLSNILSPETYFLLWGRGCKEILHDYNKTRTEEISEEMRDAFIELLNN
ncbi:hypothetical protein QEN19_003795 [Hanseniaspora menglaensis]